jgi:Uma2 family endonuclease
MWDASMPSTRAITDEELLRLPKDGNKREVVDGEVRVSPAGLRHEEVVARLIHLLLAHVLPRKLGKVFGSSAGFHIPQGHLRSPDVSFVVTDRLGDATPETYGTIAPDLAVEVLSPWDTMSDTVAKAAEYIRGGSRLVWVIDPVGRKAHVYRLQEAGAGELAHAGVHDRVIGPSDTLLGEHVVPGFSCRLDEILD